MIDSSNLSVVYDIEANHLLEKVTKVWCIYALDMNSEEGWLFHNFPQYNNKKGIDDEGNPFTIPRRSGTLEEGVEFIQNAKQIICHNQQKYDQPLMKKFFGFKPRYDYPNSRDTLIESQVQFFNRAGVKGYKGKHGLAPWGARLGIPKQEIQDWTTMDIYKLNRCIIDVKINKLVADYLERERIQLIKKCDGLDFIKSLHTEHEFAYWASIQEENGAKLDVPHMERCVEELDGILNALKIEIEPQLPPVLKPHIAGKMTYKDICEKMGVVSLPNVPKSWKRPLKEKIIEFNRSPMFYLDKPNKVEYKPNKMFATPTTKWVKTEKYKEYRIVLPVLQPANLFSGANGDYKELRFTKLKEARQWVKDNCPTVKGIKYPSEEKLNTLLDANACSYFGYEEHETWKIGGAFTKISITPSHLGQDEVVKSFLLKLGWTPTEYNVKTDTRKRTILDTETWEPINNSPKLTEDSYASLPEGLGKSIAQFNTKSHRRTYLKNQKDDSKGLLNNVREDGRITTGLNCYGTVAGRSSQYGIVNLPSIEADYGVEMRSCIIADEGCTLLGLDMSNAHHRILSFITQKETYLNAINSGKEEEQDGTYVGSDLHTMNAILFSLIEEEAVAEAVRTQDKELIGKLTSGRKKGKAPGFLSIYGGSAKALAKLLGITVPDATERKNNFLAGLGLDELLVKLDDQWNAHKRLGGAYISIFGGYNIYCGSKHKLINTMALGSESVLQKVSINILMRELTRRNSKVKLIAGFHDEILLEVPNEEMGWFKPYSENIYERGAQSIGIANNFLSVAKTGHSYATCH